MTLPGGRAEEDLNRAPFVRQAAASVPAAGRDAAKLEIRWRCPGCTLTPRPEGAIELTVDGADPVPIAMRPTLAQHVAGLNSGLSDLQIAPAPRETTTR